jgi:hypothetical protein
MDVWEQVLLAFVGSNATLVLVLGFLGRSLVQTWLTKDIKKFETELKASADLQLEHLKYELKAKGDASIEQLKSALQVASTERQIRFSNLHAKRAEVIAEVYRRAVDVEREGRIYIYKFGQVTGNDEQGEAPAIVALREFDIFVDQNRIYLSDQICQLLAGFSGLLNPPLVHALVYGRIEHPTPETLNQSHQGFKKALEAFQKDIPAARGELEREFRKILGVA